MTTEQKLVPAEMVRAMMDAGQRYLDARCLSKNFGLPATFRWTEFWDAILAAAPAAPAQEPVGEDALTAIMDCGPVGCCIIDRDKARQIYEAIYAAPVAPAPVAVKALEWRADSGWTADSPVGRYDIRRQIEGFGVYLPETSWMGPPDNLLPTLAAAKAAAQADYERRVRACLVDAPVAAGWQEPDYCYNPSEWEATYPWADRDLLADGMDSREPMEIATLIKGPTKWVAYIPSDEAKPLHWFDSEETARATIAAPLPAAPGEG